MSHVTKRDISEFRSYLRACTLSQVRSVYEKERDAGRDVYQSLAADELRDRGVQP